MFGSSGLKDKPSLLVLPVLSPGKHRNPRKGACFMEFASYLAGEKWSDHPECTHPALAELARAVNDHIGDEARKQILPLVPEVIGLNGQDPLVAIRIARECALTALPIVPVGRARVVALGLLRCERALAEHEGRAPRDLSSRARTVLERERQSYDWATAFSRDRLNTKTFRGISPVAIIDYAVVGISEAAVDDSDALLVRLLRDLVAICKGWLAAPPAERVSETDEPSVDRARS